MNKKFSSNFIFLFCFLFTSCENIAGVGVDYISGVSISKDTIRYGNILSQKEMFKFIKMYDFQVVEKYWDKESGIITKQEVGNNEYAVTTVWYSFVPDDLEIPSHGTIYIGEERGEYTNERHYEINDGGAAVLTGGLNRYIIGVRKDLKILSWYNDIEMKISDSKIVKIIKKKK